MKMWFNKKTRSKLSDDEYNKLSDEEKKDCVPDRGEKKDGKKDGKPGRKKQDYTWYQVTEAITKAVGNIPFNVFAGMDDVIRHSLITQTSTSGPSAGESTVTVPGVMSLDVILTYGESHNRSSAINIAADALYTYIRHFNSGARNYESEDLMMYVMAMSQIYAAIVEAERAYKIAKTYTYENRWIPRGLAYAANLDVKEIGGNLANFRAELNLLIEKITAVCIPDAFNIHKRHAYIMGNVFSDSDDLRGQFYMFNTRFWFKWSATARPDGSSLQPYDVTTNVRGKRDSETIINDLTALIDAVLNDQDVKTMSGDILKAFGADKLYHLAELDENATVDFIMNEDVLSQIENSRSISINESNPTVLEIYQSVSDGIVTSAPIPANPQVFVDNGYFNSHKSNPTPEDVLEWSRLISTLSSSGQYTFGTEIILRYSIFLDLDDETKRADFGTTWFQPEVFDEDAFYSRSQTLLAIGLFDWHPIIYSYTATRDTGTGYVTSVTLSGYTGDLKVTATMGYKEIKRLNDSAIMGALNSLNLLKNATSAMSK